MILQSWDRFRDIGLLVLRVGMGIMFIGHGAPKLFGRGDMGAIETWAQVGAAMGTFGIDVAPAFWGFLAAFAEFGGGLLLIAGLLFRPACFLLLATMMVAASKHLAGGDAFFGGASHAVEAGVLFLALLFIGPGRFALDRWFGKKQVEEAETRVQARR